MEELEVLQTLLRLSEGGKQDTYTLHAYVNMLETYYRLRQSQGLSSILAAVDSWMEGAKGGLSKSDLIWYLQAKAGALLFTGKVTTYLVREMGVITHSH